MDSVFELEQTLTEPSHELAHDLANVEGDIMIIGVGGKMGPTLAKLAKNAIDYTGLSKKVIGVSRFSNTVLKNDLEFNGIETIVADLLNEDDLQQLPDVKNIIFMAGNKFGTTENQHFTWAMNSYLPGRIAEKFKNSRIVSFSTVNVYPLMPVKLGGPTEEDVPEPIGDYAQSCLGRERIFDYFSHKYKIPMLHFRLSYAVDLRYGVLLEIAKAVKNKQPIRMEMGHVCVIWQGDANERALRSLTLCDTPSRILNITGPETVSVRWLAEWFGEKLGEEPILEGKEEDTALLGNAAKSQELFGYPKVSLLQMMNWTVEWVMADGVTYEKATHFQERKGAF